MELKYLEIGKMVNLLKKMKIEVKKLILNQNLEMILRMPFNIELELKLEKIELLHKLKVHLYLE
jgi:hypothetical protein